MQIGKAKTLLLAKKNLLILYFKECTCRKTLASGWLGGFIVWDHSFSTYAKFSEKLTFLILWYALIRPCLFYRLWAAFSRDVFQCCLTFSWIELQMLPRCCLIDKSIITLRQVLYLLYLCPTLDLGLFMSHLFYLFFSFIFIFIRMNRIISLIQTHLLFWLFF